MSRVRLLRFLHILSAIAFICRVLARQVVCALTGSVVTQARGDAGTFADLKLAAGTLLSGLGAALLVIPGNMAVISFGVALALVTRTPIFGSLQSAQQNWLLATMALLVTGFAAAPRVFVPRGKLFDAARQRAVQPGAFTPELWSILPDPVVSTVHALKITLVVAVLLFTVFKPF